MNSEIRTYTKVVNKETRRISKSLFQKILLKKANSALIYEMINNDDAGHNLKKFVFYRTIGGSTANQVAEYLL